MRKLSRIVTSRLAAQQGHGTDHPDVNLLQAFAERSLGGRERSRVLGHLVQCPKCREVIALTLAPDQTPQSAAVVPDKRLWRNGWLWQLPAAAVVVCLAMTAVWYSGSFSEIRPPAPDVARRKVPAPADVSSAARNLPQASEQSTPPQVTAHNAVAASKPKLTVKRFMRGEPARAAAPSQISAPATDDESPSSEEASHPEKVLDHIRLPAPALAPSSKETRDLAASLALQTTLSKTPTSGTLLQRDAVQSFRSGLGNAARLPATRKTLSLESNTAARSLWRLSTGAGSEAMGTVQRSVDGGKTWQAVPVEDDSRLYALSSSGSDVWVGGASGVLFHSSDGGTHWKRVVVSDERAQLNDTITRIDAADQIIRLRASSGATWTSADTGLHWRVQ